MEISKGQMFPVDLVDSMRGGMPPDVVQDEEALRRQKQNGFYCAWCLSSAGPEQVERVRSKRILT